MSGCRDASSRCSWMRCCFSGYIAGTDGYYGASHDIPAADRPVGIIRWGELVIYSAEVVECTGYQKNILDICPFVDNPHTKGLHFHQ